MLLIYIYIYLKSRSFWSTSALGRSWLWHPQAGAAQSCSAEGCAQLRLHVGVDPCGRRWHRVARGGTGWHRVARGAPDGGCCRLPISLLLPSQHPAQPPITTEPLQEPAASAQPRQLLGCGVPFSGRSTRAPTRGGSPGEDFLYFLHSCRVSISMGPVQPDTQDWKGVCTSPHHTSL